MKKIALLLIVAPLLMAASLHKYYLSVTDIVYDQDEKSVQMISRLFYDDLEAVLQERYDETIVVDATANQEKLDLYLEKYLKKKLIITINGQQKTLQFLGKEYEDDYVVCYMEVVDIEGVMSFEVENQMLMDLFPDQKNMVHTTIGDSKKSFLLTIGNAKGLLKF